MIYANQDNPGAVYANWTVIHTGGPAGSGATDGATAKGTAGFDSAGFDVTANGWVQAKTFGGTTPGYVPDASAVTGDKFLKRDGTWAAGPVTSVSSITIDAGLTGTSNPITSTGNIGPNYTGVANIILSGTDGVGVTLTGTESFMFSDDADSNIIKYATLSKIKTYVGANPGTGTQYRIPLWDTTGTLGNSALLQDSDSSGVTKINIDNGVDLEFGALSDLVTANGAATNGLYLKSKGVGAGWMWDSPGGGVSSVTFTQGGDIAAATTLNESIEITPTTGAVVIKAKKFAGVDTAGVVTSTTGEAGKFLKGDGTWDTVATGAPTRTVNRSTISGTSTNTHNCGSVNQTDVNYIDLYVSGVYQTKNLYTASYSAPDTTVQLASGNFPDGAVVESVILNP